MLTQSNASRGRSRWVKKADSAPVRRQRRTGFTLIEVLVVVAIIALLISILLPSLAMAKRQAKASVCLSNLKQVGIGLTTYLAEHKDRYPKHSSPGSAVPRTRWPDYMYRSIRSTEIFECPSLDDRQLQDFRKPFAHTVNQDTGALLKQTQFHGGYGYNFQYLGNARTKSGGSAPPDWAEPFHASTGQIKHTANTVAVADTRGSKKGDPDRAFGEGGSAVYVIDPPLGSYELGSRGSRKNADRDVNNLWYEGGTDYSEEYLVRSQPEERHLDKVNSLFCDGHAEAMLLKKLDGRMKDDQGDNRYYNGYFDTGLR